MHWGPFDAMEPVTVITTTITVFILVTFFNMWLDMAAARKLQKRLDALAAQGRETHALVNSQLTEAVERMREAMRVASATREVLRQLAPNDPQVQALLSGTAEQQADAPGAGSTRSTVSTGLPKE